MALFTNAALIDGQFMPHGHCLLWQPSLIWLHAGADTLTALAYYSIPVGLLYFVYKRQDLHYRWMFVLFAVFIFACGSTHALDLWTLWHPDYGLQGWVKLVNATVSSTAAVLLWPLIPRALEVPSRKALTESYQRLEEEIRQHRHTEVALRQSEEQLRRFVKFAPLAVAMFDRKLCYLGFSQRWLKNFALEADVLGRCHYEVFPDLPERWKAAHRAGLAGQVLQAEEDRFERADGTVLWTRWVLAPWYDREGQVGGIIIFAEDILARKELEMEREQLVHLIERSTDFIVTFASDGRIKYLNAAASRRLGQAQVSGEPLTFNQFISPKSSTDLLASLIPAVQARGMWEGEIPIREAQTGQQIDAQCTVFSLPGYTPKETAFGAVMRDITLQKRTQALLVQREAELRQLLDALPALVAYIDKDQRYRIVNKTYEAWYARPCAEVEGYTVREVLGEARYSLVQPNLARALKGETVMFELTFPYPDGKVRFIRLTYVPNTDSVGNVLGMYLIIEDLTEIHQTAEALRAARDNIEQEVQERTLALRQSNAALKAEIAERERTEQALLDTSADLAEAQRVARIGNWHLDVATKTVRWSEELFRIFDFPPSPSDSVYMKFLNRVHPDDSARIRTAHTQAESAGSPFDVDYRIVINDGSIKTIREVGYAKRDVTGRVIGLFGTAMDITELRAAEKARLDDAHTQRQALVREVHHRIKNHLQGLVGLFEQFEAKCPAAAEYFQQAATQTKVIATIHGLQAHSGDEESRLVSVIQAILNTAQGFTNIPIELHASDSTAHLHLEERSAVPIALVINELVLNAIKHGRYDALRAKLHVYLDQIAEEFCLRVVNPGHMPQSSTSRSGSGLGLARLLLPREGAVLEVSSIGSSVEASLRLGPPVVVSRTQNDNVIH